MGLDINLNTSKIDISEDDGLNVDLYKDNIDISNDEADDIIIEITGLKSISKFIGLEDTPLYYDNGKFFKVEDNKIVYADIQWKDISGNLEDAPEIIDLIKELVKNINEEVINDYIDKHNNSQFSHPYIRNVIEQNYNTLDVKIDNTKEELSKALNTEIINRETADNKLSENIQQETLARIEADTTLQNNINSVASDLSDEISARESVDTTLSNSISDLSDGLIQEITDRQTADTGLQSQITSNYNTLDSKIDSVESSLNDLSDTVDTNDTAINNKVDNINNTLTNSISTLSDTVSNNYTTLDNKIDSVEGALADSITALDNKYDNITSGLDDKIDDVDDTLTTHISDNSNPHNVTKTQIGLSNVDNTSDLNKPISTATQTALDGKVPNTRTVNNKPLSSDIVLDYSDVNALPDTTTINDLTTTAQQNALNSGIDSTLTQQITTNQNNISNLSSTVSSNYTTLDNRITSEVNTLNGSISDEETARINADNGLQSQIDAITSASDVTDIVGTYAELQAYDTTSLPDKSIIKVLQDESRNNETTYYRWVITNGTGVWVLIGEEGPYYTKSEADGRFVNQATTVNNKALSSNITLTASDVGALPDNTVIGDGTLTIQKNGTTIDTFTANTTSNKTINITVPTDTQDLTNGAGYITSSALNGYATENFVLNQGYITGITSTDITTALGYVPYNSTNPSGYTTNVGTVTSVNNTQPDANGNVTLTIPDTATWGNITGTLSDQTDLQTALDAKQNTISDLSTIRSGASAGATALQPNDNITELVNNAGYITGITSSDVTTALGYTPYNSTNPSGYITSSDLPTNHVTTDTAQSISGQKTFTSTIKSSVNNSLSLTLSTGEAFGVTVKRTDANNEIKFGIGSGGDNRGIWDARHNKWAFHVTNNGKSYALGNEIAIKSDLNSLSPLRYSRYSIAQVNSTNKFIKLASMTFTQSGNRDFSYLFWVEILEASTAKCYALVRLSARWSNTSYQGHKFEILEKYGEPASSLEALKNLTYAYSLNTTTHKITAEIWLEIRNKGWVSYYLRPTECNEYGDYSNTPVTLNDNIWTYYNKSGDASNIASTAITSGLTKVKVTDATGVRNENNLSQVIKMWTGTKAEYDAIVTKDTNTLYWLTDAKIIYLGENAIGNFKGGRNIGEIVSSSLPLTDAGLHLLDGSLILGGGIYQGFVDYIADLYAENPSANYFCTESDWQSSVSTYGSCGKFVYDSTNNTVRLPKVTGIVEGTTDISALGDLVEAGLPNITGTIHQGVTDGYINVDNGFIGVSLYNLNNRASGGLPFRVENWSFDASRSSSIYGNSNTVQPQTIKVLYYIVIANSTKTDIQVDIDKIATDLNGKADVDLSNTTDSAKVMMSSMGMPSDKYIDLTLGASGTTYKAPANGWFILQASTSGECNIIWRNNTNDEPYQEKRVYTAVGTSLIHPILKNNIFYLSYESALSNVKFRFYYAKGSESEA